MNDKHGGVGLYRDQLDNVACSVGADHEIAGWIVAKLSPPDCVYVCVRDVVVMDGVPPGGGVDVTGIKRTT